MVTTIILDDKIENYFLYDIYDASALADDIESNDTSEWTPRNDTSAWNPNNGPMYVRIELQKHQGRLCCL